MNEGQLHTKLKKNPSRMAFDIVMALYETALKSLHSTVDGGHFRDIA
jgi:hypothetical protein